MDWCDGGPVGPLARLSYTLHKTLASELGQDTGYREVRTFSVAASAKPGTLPLHLALLLASLISVCAISRSMRLETLGSFCAPISFDHLSLCRSRCVNCGVW